MAEETREDILVSVKVDTGNSSEEVKQLTTDIDKLASTTEDMNESTEKSSMSWNSFKDGLNAVVPGLGGLVSGIEAGTKASLAFIATPLGATLALIAAGLGAVASYFKSTGDGADKLEQIMAGLSGAFNVFKDLINSVGRTLVKAFEDPQQAMADFWEFLKENIVNRIEGLLELIPKLGEAISLVFEGEFAAAGKVALDAVAKVTLGVEDFTDKIATLTEEIIKESNAMIELTKQMQALEDRERAYELQASKTELEIQRLILASKNRKLSMEEQEALLERAGELEKKNAAELVSIQEQKLAMTLKEAGMRIDLEREKGESLDAYTKRLLNASTAEGELTDEVKDKIIAASVAVDQARGESLNVQEKIQNRIDAIEEKALADKVAAEEAKADATKKRLDKEAKDTEKARADQEKKDKKEKDEKDKQDKKDATEKLKLEEFVAKGQLDILSKITTEKSSVRMAGTALLKKDAIAEATTQTYKGAISAYSSLAGIPIIGPVLGAIAAVAVTAYGLMQVASISGVNFAKGGQAWGKTLGGQRHGSGGTKFWGTDGTFFEAESDEGLFVLNRGAHADFLAEQSQRNQRFGGRSWFGGGTSHAALGGEISTMTVDRYVAQQNQLDLLIQAIGSMPPPRVDVTDIYDGLNNKVTVENEATL